MIVVSPINRVLYGQFATSLCMFINTVTLSQVSPAIVGPIDSNIYPIVVDLPTLMPYAQVSHLRIKNIDLMHTGQFLMLD